MTAPGMIGRVLATSTSIGSPSSRQRVRHEAVIPRIAHRRVEEAVDHQGAGRLVHLVLDRLAADRHLDDGVDVVGRVVADRDGVEVHGVTLNDVIDGGLVQHALGRSKRNRRPLRAAGCVFASVRDLLGDVDVLGFPEEERADDQGHDGDARSGTRGRSRCCRTRRPAPSPAGAACRRTSRCRCDTAATSTV